MQLFWSIKEPSFLTVLADLEELFSYFKGSPVIIVNGYDAINEVAQTNKGYDFASKDPMYTVRLANPKQLGE